MNNKARRVVTGVLAVIFAFGVFMMIRQGLDKSQGRSDYDRALQVALSGRDATEPAADTTSALTEPTAQIVWIPEKVENDPVMEELEEVDLEALRQVNPDVVGWIRIPNAKIDYPVVQGEDNDYYLNHTWEKNKNSVGAIFMEYQNNPNMGDYNTLIYGHNMEDNSMFTQLHRYNEQKFYEEHPYVYLVTDSGIFRYEIFSSYKAEIDSEAYRLSFQQGQTRENFLATTLERSVIETGIEPEIRDRILTLSTCSGVGYSTRWVVHARLKLVQTEI